jgi:hypothetical protein
MKSFQLPVVVLAILALPACGGVGLLGGTEEKQEAVATEVSPQAPEENHTNDEVILPSAPEAPVIPTSPEESAPAPAADPVAAFSLNITADKDFDTRLGLVRLSWASTGQIEEIYLWSAGFNREAGDAAEDDPCGKIGKRHLLVNSKEGDNLGFELNDGTPAHEALLPYLNSARSCDESICEGYAASADGTPVCRIDLDPAIPSGAFYTRTLTRNAVYHVCAKTAEGTTCTASDAVATPQVSFEGSSAEMSADGKIRFTLNYLYAVREVSAPIGCVKDNGGSTFSDRNRGQGILVASCPLDGPKISLSSVGRRKLSFQSTPAQEDQTSSLSFRKVADATFRPNADLQFSAQGIGAGNSDAKYYKIDKASPVLTLRADGAVACDDADLTAAHCPGRIDLVVEATREFDLLEIKAGSDAEKVLHGKAPAGLPIVLSSNQGPSSLAAVPTESAAETLFKGVPRDHDHHKWRATVELDGKTYKSDWWKAPPLAAGFKLLSATQTLHPSNWDTCSHEDTDDGESECGVCVETSGFYQATVAWEGRHLKNVGVYCTSANEGVVTASPVAIPNSYEKQGNLLGSPALSFQVPVNRSNWSDELVCILTGQAYDGTAIVRMQMWKPSCNYTHASPGDPHDPDLEGAFIENGTGWANAGDLWTLVSSQWDGE